TIITDEFRDTEDNDGVFSGLNPATRRYDPSKWRYETDPRGPTDGGDPQTFAALVGSLVGPHAHQDPTLQHERCVYRILKKHYQRYTPQMVEEVCGTPGDIFQRVADAVWNNAGPDKSGAICYAVGWTQHTTGVQMIRAAAVLQLLLGNIGRP